MSYKKLNIIIPEHIFPQPLEIWQNIPTNAQLADLFFVAPHIFEYLKRKSPAQNNFDIASGINRLENKIDYVKIKRGTLIQILLTETGLFHSIEKIIMDTVPRSELRKTFTVLLKYISRELHFKQNPSAAASESNVISAALETSIAWKEKYNKLLYKYEKLENMFAAADEELSEVIDQKNDLEREIDRINSMIFTFEEDRGNKFNVLAAINKLLEENSNLKKRLILLENGKKIDKLKSKIKIKPVSYDNDMINSQNKPSLTNENYIITAPAAFLGDNQIITCNIYRSKEHTACINNIYYYKWKITDSSVAEAAAPAFATSFDFLGQDCITAARFTLLQKWTDRAPGLSYIDLDCFLAKTQAFYSELHIKNYTGDDALKCGF